MARISAAKSKSKLKKQWERVKKTAKRVLLRLRGREGDEAPQEAVEHEAEGMGTVEDVEQGVPAVEEAQQGADQREELVVDAPSGGRLVWMPRPRAERLYQELEIGETRPFPPLFDGITHEAHMWTGMDGWWFFAWRW